jgi:hypothetical protein
MDEAKLQMLIDRMEISDTMIRYCTSYDTRDWDSFRSTLTDPFELDFTCWWGGDPVVVTPDEWIEKVRGVLMGFRASQHFTTNHSITVSGDEATGVFYVLAQHYLPTEMGSNCFLLGGFYDTTFVRTSQGWKISKHKLTISWTEGNLGLFDEAARLFNGSR